MSGFRFRLEAPLRFGRVRRQLLRSGLAQEVRRSHELELAIADTAASARGHHLECVAADGRTLTGAELAMHAIESERAAERMRRLFAASAECEVEERGLRERLAATSNEVRVLESMETRARRAHQRKLDARVQSEVDELTVLRHAARRRVS